MAGVKPRTGKTTSRRRSAAYRSGARSRGRRPVSLTAREEQLKREWDALIEPIIDAWRVRPETGVAPYDQKANYLRREVYRVIRKLDGRSEGRAIIEAAVRGHCGSEPTRVSMAQNLFFWGLKAIAARITLEPDRVSRLAKEMLYAFRHEIEPDLLIGFILQTGAARIHKKDGIEVESWFSRRASDI